MGTHLNIFYVDTDPLRAAQALCDKHVVKMTLETAQLLCNAVPDEFPGKYRSTHTNHPCNLWASASIDHYVWLMRHLSALGYEYTHRYGKTHKSALLGHVLPDFPNLPYAGWVAPPQCMPDQYRISRDTVAAYRRYYVGEKAKFARWTKRQPPQWFLTLQQSSA